MRLTRLVAIVGTFATAGRVQAATLNVPADFPTIQSAINAAAPNDTVLVAPGTYIESINLLGKLIALTSSGGAAVTTIQADRTNGSVISCISGEPIDSLISGFTISGGTGSTIQGGGGLLIIKSAMTVYECIFEGNAAVQGGGVALIEGDLFISNCTFNSNHAVDEGGGLHSSNAQLLADHCTFNFNCAHFGGGVHAHGGTTTLSNCDFLNNQATSAPCETVDGLAGFTDAAGGAVHAETTELDIYHCDFIANNADFGGAVRIEASPTSIELSLFSENVGFFGGALASTGSDTEILDSIFEFNSADQDGAASISNAAGFIVIDDCTFTGNTAFDGGAGSMGASKLTIEDSLFSENCCDQLGGALNLYGGAADVLDCTFTGNRAIGTSGQCGKSPRALNLLSPSLGGAIRTGAAMTRIVVCDFDSNIANPQFGAGGAIYAIEQIEIRYSTFRNNIATGGGAVAASKGVSILGCIFEKNSGTSGAGALELYSAGQAFTVLLDDVEFIGNDSNGGAGALALLDQPATMHDCRFIGNQGATAGALLAYANSQTVDVKADRCRFVGNQAAGRAGAVKLEGEVQAVVTNSLFESNTAGTLGGALFVSPAFLMTAAHEFINCTFAGNAAAVGGGSVLHNGETVPVDPVHVDFHNCILWDNDGAPIVNGPLATTAATFSDVQGGYAGEGNVDVDPLFFGPLDRRLTVGSPCLNVGNNDLIPDGITMDLNGRQRIQNGTVDMGAYEGFTCIGDIALHGDGEVDVDDILMIISDWGCNPSMECFADVTGDGFVDVDDLLAVINHWGPCE
jgi:hypothetical protein